MQSPSPEQSVRSTGLPPGVEAGELGPRFLAAAIDWLAPLLVVGVLNGIAGTLDAGAGRVALMVLGSLVGLAWFVVVWWMFATKAAGPGMRVMKLQLVGLSDGRPVGWLRYLGRYVVLSLLAGTGIGLIVLLVLLLQNPRRQGLHDLVVDSVVIKERALAPRPASSSAPGATVPAVSTPAPAGPTPAPAGPTPAPAGPTQAPTGPGAQLPSPGVDHRASPSPFPGEDQVPGPAQPQYGPQARSYQPAHPPQPPAGPSALTTPSPASADFPVGGQYPLHGSAVDAPAAERSPEAAAGSNPVSTVFPAAAPPSVSLTGGAAAADLPSGDESADAVPADAVPADAVRADAEPTDALLSDARGAESGAQAEHVGVPAAEPGRPLDEGWVAGLDDGRDLEVAGLVLLGRNPQGRPGEDEAELIKIADDTRTVSKTHLALGVDANGMYVMDRGSTNGSTVTSAGGVSTPCPAGAVIQVDEGNIVSFGDHWLEIKRSPAPEQ